MNEERPVLSLSLADILTIWRRRGAWILGAVTLGALIALLVSFVQTPRYQAITSLLPGKAEAVSAFIPTLERGVVRGGLKFSNVTTRNSENLEVLVSDRLQTRLIEDLDLVEYYGYGELAATDSARAFMKTLRDLRRDSHFGLPLGLELLFVEVQSTDPDMAARIANAYVALLDTLNLDRLRRFATAKVGFLDEQIAGIERELLAAQTQLSDFQRQHGILDLEREWDQVFELEQRLTAGLVQLELERGRIVGSTGPRSPEALALAAQIAVYEDVIAKMRRTLGGRESAPTLAPADLATSLGQLERQIELLRLIEGEVIAERETARLQAMLDIGTTTVLDRALVPSEPIWPDRKLLVGVTAGSLLLLGGLISLAEALLRQLGAGSLRAGWQRLLRES